MLLKAITHWMGLGPCTAVNLHDIWKNLFNLWQIGYALLIYLSARYLTMGPHYIKLGLQPGIGLRNTR